MLTAVYRQDRLWRQLGNNPPGWEAFDVEGSNQESQEEAEEEEDQRHEASTRGREASRKKQRMIMRKAQGHTAATLALPVDGK